MKPGKILAAAAGIGTVALAVSGQIMYSMALKAHGNRKAIFRAEENRIGVEKEEAADIETAEFKDAWITSKYDGILLHGNVIDRKSRTWVIAMHGYSSYGKKEYVRCSGWNDRRYSLLCPDMRGQGESEGEYIGMGWHDRFDIISWIEYINENYEPDNIILYGVSMGASAVMMTAGEELPENVKCIIEDSGYAAVKEEFRHEGKVVFKVPYYPFVFAGSIITKLKAGWSFEEASSAAQLRKAKVPVMFIHGDADRFVPICHVHEAYEACASEKKLFIAAGAGHVQAQNVDRGGYWKSIYEFADRYLN